MIGDNNPVVLLADIAFCLVLIRGIAIEGARIESHRKCLNAPDEMCKEAGSLTLLLVILLLGTCGLCSFALNLLAR